MGTMLCLLLGGGVGAAALWTMDWPGGRPLAWACCVGLALAAAFALRGRSAAPRGATAGSAARVGRGSGGATLPLAAVSAKPDRGAVRTTGD